jgi:hypothetical protein
MPSKDDVAELARFLRETLETLELVIDTGYIRTYERELVRAATQDFQARHPQQILEAYQAAPDPVLDAAGVLGRQLAAKVGIASITGEHVRAEVHGDDYVGSERRYRRPRTGNVRPWIKRAKILVGSLAGILPPVEALSELLDLLDAALDRPHR